MNAALYHRNVWENAESVHENGVFSQFLLEMKVKMIDDGWISKRIHI